MNSHFLPGNRDPKPGLESVRKLVAAPNPEESAKVRESIPSNWFYNENNANQIWNDLEAFEYEKIDRSTKENDPLKQIDDTAQRIKNTIQAFELQDEEFLLRFLQIMGDDNEVGEVDSEAVLFEARSRLQEMIDEHVDFSTRQNKLLESIYYWIKLTRNDKIDDNEKIPDDDKSAETLKQLQDAINDMIKRKENQGEEASLLHTDIVNILSHQVNEYQKQLTQKNLELSQLEQETKNKKKKGISGRASARDSIMNEQFSRQQRKIIDLQAQVAKLKDVLEQLKNNPGSSEDAEKIISDLANQESDDKMDSYQINLEREIEFENRIKAIQEEMKSIKQENKQNREQFMKAKHNELLYEKKNELLERQKKSLESQISSLQKKIDQNEATFQERLNVELQKIEISKQSSAPPDPSIEITKKYEAKIQELMDANRKQIKCIEDANDSKMKKRFDDITKALQSGDTKKVFEETCRTLNEKIDYLKESKETEIKELKSLQSEKIMQLSKHYENLLNKKQHENEVIRDSVESQVRNRLLELRLEIEDKANQKNLEEQTKMAMETKEKMGNFMTQISTLEQKLSDVTRQRDSYKAILINSDMLDEDEEDEDDDEAGEKSEDDVLQESLFALKEKEIEQKVTERFSLLLKQQLEVLQESKKWEIEEAKNDFKAQYEKNLSEFRMQMANSVQQIYDASPHDNPVLEDLLIRTLSSVDKHIQGTDGAFNQAMIPVSEVEIKLNELQQKLIEATSENEIYKAMLDKMKGSPTFDKDAFQSAKEAMEEQSKKMGEIARQNVELQNEVKVLSNKVSAAISRQISNSDLLNTLRDHYVDVETNTDPVAFATEQSSEVVARELPNSKLGVKSTLTSSEVFRLADSPPADFLKDKEKIQDDNFPLHTQCVHCHKAFGFQPNDIVHKLAMSSIISCPICNKKMILNDQFTDETQSSNKDSILINEIDTTGAQNGGKTNDNQQSSRSKTSAASEHNSSRYKEEIQRQKDISANIEKEKEEEIKSLKKQLAEMNQNREPTEEEINARLKEKEDQKKSSEMKALIEQNNQLKAKLLVSRQSLQELEKQYAEKVGDMEEKINEMRNQYVEKSMDVVQNAKSLPSTNEYLKPKIQASKAISDDMANLTLAQSHEASAEVERIKGITDLFSSNTSLGTVEDTLEQQHKILTQIKDEPEQRSTRVVQVVPLSIRRKITTLELDYAAIKGQFELFLKKINENLEDAKEQVLRTIRILVSLHQTNSSKFEQMAKEIEGLNEVIWEKEKTIKLQAERIEKIQEENENLKKLNDQLRLEITNALQHIQKMEVEKGGSNETINILQKTEQERERHIDVLTNDVVKSQNQVHAVKKELENAQMKQVELENQFLFFQNMKEKIQEIDDVRPSYENMPTTPIPPDRNMEYVPPFVIYQSSGPQTGGFALLSKREAALKFMSESTPLFTIEPSNKDDDIPIQMPINKESRPSLLQEKTSSSRSDKTKPSQKTQLIIKKPSSSIRITTAKSPIRTPLKPPKPVSLIIDEDAKQANISTKPPTQVPTITIHNTPPKPQTPTSKSHMSKPQTPTNRLQTPTNQKTPTSSSRYQTLSTLPQTPITPQAGIEFDYLIPLTTDNTNGASLVAYVTRYVQQKPDAPPPVHLLHPSINTTPAYTSPTPSARTEASSTGNTAYNTSRSRATATARESQTPTEKQIVIETLQQQKLDTTTYNNLLKRTKQLEGMLNEKIKEGQNIKDKAHDLSINLYRIKQELTRTTRQKNKAERLNESSKKQLQSALNLVVERDKQIQELKKMIAQFRVIADAVNNRLSAQKIDESTNASKLIPKKAITEMMTLLGKSHHFANMAANEMRSLERWQAKRLAMVEEEREKLLKILKASGLLTENNTTPRSLTIIRPDELLKKKSTRKSSIKETTE